jgi:hypothetical protein
MRASRFRVFCAAVALAHCGYLAACTGLTEEPTAEAAPVDGVTVASGDGSGAVRPVARVPTFRAGEDAIAALIPAE